MPSKKKKYNARFPPARIKKIMQADEEVGKVSAVVPVMVSRILEVFVESLLQKACHVTRSRNARTLTPVHIKATINSDSQYSFLREVVASVPDIPSCNEDEGDHPQLSSSSSSSSVLNNCPVPASGKRKTGASSSSRSLNNNASSSRAKLMRGKSKSPLRTQCSVSRDEEDEEGDEDDVDVDEDEDDDDGSSGDNNLTATPTPSTPSLMDKKVALLTTSSSSTPPSLQPQPTLSAADLVDDDYDDV